MTAPFALLPPHIPLMPHGRQGQSAVSSPNRRRRPAAHLPRRGRSTHAALPARRSPGTEVAPRDRVRGAGRRAPARHLRAGGGQLLYTSLPPAACQHLKFILHFPCDRVLEPGEPVPGPAHAWGARVEPARPPGPACRHPRVPVLRTLPVIVPSHDCHSFCAEMSPSATSLWWKRTLLLPLSCVPRKMLSSRSLRKRHSVFSFSFLSCPFFLVWFLTAVENGLYKDCLLIRTEMHLSFLKINGRPLSPCSR